MPRLCALLARARAKGGTPGQPSVILPNPVTAPNVVTGPTTVSSGTVIDTGSRAHFMEYTISELSQSTLAYVCADPAGFGGSAFGYQYASAANRFTGSLRANDGTLSFNQYPIYQQITTDQIAAGGAWAIGKTVRTEITPDKRLRFSIGGVVVWDQDVAAFLAANPNNAGVFFRTNGTPVQNLTYGVYSVPLDITAQTLLPSYIPTATLTYTGSPYAYKVRIETSGGAVLVPYEPVVIVSSEKGKLVVRGSTGAPTSQFGASVNVRWAEVDSTGTVVRSFVASSLMPDAAARIGMNPDNAATFNTLYSNTARFEGWQDLSSTPNNAAYRDPQTGSLTGCPAAGLRIRVFGGEASGTYWMTYKPVGGTPIISLFGTEGALSVSNMQAPVGIGGGYLKIVFTMTFDRTVGNYQDALFKLTGGWINDFDVREATRPRSEVIRPERIARDAIYAFIRPMDWEAGNANSFYTGDWNASTPFDPNNCGRTLPTYERQSYGGYLGFPIEDIILYVNSINALRLSQGKAKAGMFCTPPPYSSSDYLTKYVRALLYGEGVTRGGALTDGTEVIISLTGNEMFNNGGSAFKAAMAYSYQNGRATSAEVAASNGAGNATVFRREQAFLVNRNGPIIAAAAGAKANLVTRDVTVQSTNAPFDIGAIGTNGGDYANIESFSIAPYPGDFINPVGNSSRPNTTDLDVLFSRFNDSIDEFDAAYGAAKTAAKSKGKRLVAYEGNRSFNGSSLDYTTTAAFTLDPRMKIAQRRIIDLSTARGDVVCMYLSCSQIAAMPQSSFGWQRYQGDESFPARQAMIEAIAASGL